MCGRFASARKRQELLAEFRIERDRVTQPLEPDYNVAPTKPVYAVLTRAGRDDGDTGRRAARELRVVRWGLVPSWAKDTSISARLINARAETVDSKPAFRQAFARRRCLLPADGFYEWQPVAEGGRTRKQPYYIHRGDGGVLAFAGLYEIWRDSALGDGDDRAWLWSATIITTRAADEVGRIHDRMPMVIEQARWADWLDPATTGAADLRPLLAPALAGGLASYQVPPDVNSVRNNGPGLIRPLAGAPGGEAGPAARVAATADSDPTGGHEGDDPGGPHRPRRQADPRHRPAGAPLTLF